MLTKVWTTPPAMTSQPAIL